MSLGFRKTEDDECHPEIKFDMYKKRISELNNISQK